MGKVKDSHVLVVTGGGILLIGGDDDLVALLDGDVLVVDGVTGTDLRTFLRGRSVMSWEQELFANPRCQEQWQGGGPSEPARPHGRGR